MDDWLPPVAPAAPAARAARAATLSPALAPSAGIPIAARSTSEVEWEYRLRALNRQSRFERTCERAEDTHSKRLWCLMLTLMILCGAAVLVAVVVAAFVFISQNQK